MVADTFAIGFRPYDLNLWIMKNVNWLKPFSANQLSKVKDRITIYINTHVKLPQIPPSLKLVSTASNLR